jgi:DNA-binding transcriptional regulator YiaG
MNNKNKALNYWINNWCDFYKKLNKWLKENNKKLDIYETNPLGAIRTAFDYWLHNLKEDLEPQEALKKWLEKNKNNLDYWSKGKEVDFNVWKKSLKDYCKDEDEDTEENIVKKVCKELGITQKELAERLGVNEGTPAQWSSKGNIPEMAQNFMELLIKYEKNKKEIEKVRNALKILDEIKGS